MRRIPIIKKYTVLLFTALTVAVIVYPFFHEMGHILPMLLFRADIKEISVFPSFSVLCDISSISKNRQIIIAISGGLFPILISLLWNPKSKYFFFAGTILKLLNIYYIVFNIVCAFMFIFKVPVTASDITIILTVNPHFFLVILFSHFFLSIILLIILVKGNTLSSCLSLF